MTDEQRENFLTIFKIGYFKSAPGTWGSLVGFIVGIPILYFSSFTLFLLAVLIGAIAIKQIDIYEEKSQTHDAKHIVIDEVVGIFIAMSVAQFSLPSVILAFIFFRIYDIYKPSIIGKVDSTIGGGIGVVGDDALAGFFAGITSLFVVAILNLFGVIEVQFL